MGKSLVDGGRGRGKGLYQGFLVLTSRSNGERGRYTIFVRRREDRRGRRKYSRIKFSRSFLDVGLSFFSSYIYIVYIGLSFLPQSLDFYPSKAPLYLFYLVIDHRLALLQVIEFLFFYTSTRSDGWVRVFIFRWCFSSHRAVVERTQSASCRNFEVSHRRFKDRASESFKPALENPPCDRPLCLPAASRFNNNFTVQHCWKNIQSKLSVSYSGRTSSIADRRSFIGNMIYETG